MEAPLDERPALRRYPVVAGAFAASLGAAVLLGWALEMGWLQNLAPDAASMKPNAALAFVLSGLALLGLASRRAALAATAVALGALVLALGLLTLAEYALGWDAGIDRLLFSEDPGPVGTGSPGRMAPQAALGFALAGAALLLVGGTSRWHRIGELAAMLAAVVGFSGLLGYLYRIDLLYDLPGRTASTAPHGAVALLVLASGILLVRPERGLMASVVAPDAGGTLARSLLPAAVIVPLLLGALVLAGQRAGLYGERGAAALLVTLVTVVLCILVRRVAARVGAEDRERRRAERAFRDEAEIVGTLNEVGELLATQLDEEKLVQAITELATQHTSAAHGAFFFNPPDQKGERSVAYSLGGAPRAALERFPLPQTAPLFDATFRGVGPMRIDDILAHPEHGRLAPAGRLPEGRQSVRSYLAVPVRGADGEVIGGLFFGHPEPGAFTAKDARLVVGVAAWAGTAMENARLYEELRTAVENREQILSVVSHDLRNGLHSVTCAAEALRMQPSSGPPEADALRIIQRSVHQMGRLIQDLLDIAAIEAGSLRLDPVEGAIEPWIREGVDLIQPTAKGHDLRIESALGAGEGLVRGDGRRIVQVLGNLLGNAIRFTPAGGRITVRAEPEDGRVKVSVEDTGSGIAPEDLPRVFDRFWTGAESRKLKGRGAGLGLAIARAIVEGHGGRIWAESEPGLGTMFHFTLPRVVPRQEARPAAPESAHGGRRETETERREKRPRARKSSRP